ncbi:glycosyltransferase involved in cell wall biosynthesis [Methanococcus voltae]|uniref:glycosyltransferase n=1 Tax=Methanococcus voltae TaxID=2188 RepID=UPI001AE15648|nr:glycosyltransferase [Methanococcus voltae]MBP2143470.1 glycosyltransferase involved in cell wall biosynthesis [Methanococcus voltae]
MKNFKDKNLLVITRFYPDGENLIIGDSFVKGQVDELAKNFNKIYVVSPIPYVPAVSTLKNAKFLSFITKKLDIKPDLKNYKDKNVEVYYPKYLHLPVSKFRNEMGDNQFKAIDKLLKSQNIEFDLIHSHFIWGSGYTGVKLKEKYGKPLVITGHGFDVYDLPFKDEYWNTKIKGILKNTDKIITVSEKNVKCINKLGYDAELIPNGYNNLFKNFEKSHVDELKDKLKIPKDEYIILTVGNLIEIKNQETLIKSLKLFNENQTKNFKCYIIGEGHLKEYLINLIKEYDLSDNIQLLGKIPHDEIPNWMNCCDLFVLPSLNEGNPTVMFEILGCNKYMIGSNVGGIPNILYDEKYGRILKNPKDENELFNLINDTYLNKELIDYNEISKYANSFSWEIICEKILKEYTKLII